MVLNMLTIALAVFVCMCTGFSNGEERKCIYEISDTKRANINFPTKEEIWRNNSSCIWVMEVPKGKTIALSVINLNLDVNDILEVTDYSDARLLQNRTFGYLAANTVLYSISEVLMVELKFATASNVTFNAVMEEASCGGVLQSNSDFIEVPLFAHLAEASQDCSWEIKAMPGKRIKVSFLQFYLREGSCIYENLVIKEGSDPNEQLLGDFCEESPPMGDVTSNSDIMTIQYTKRPNPMANSLSEMFAAKSTVETPVIKLRYEQFDPCRSNIVGLFGSITVPAIDGSNDRGDTCYWDIQVPHNYRISLTFLKYTTALRDNGGAQELWLYDGNTEDNSSLIWIARGDSLPPSQFHTRSEGLRMELKTIPNASSSNRISFNAVYQAQLKSNDEFVDCISIGDRMFYQCSNGHYIDCDWKCDGEADCDDGIDEFFCSKEDQGFAVSQIIRPAPLKEVGSALLMFTVIGSAILVCVLVLSFERILQCGEDATDNQSQPKQGRSFVSYKLPSLPPYSPSDPTPLTPVTPPPAYQVELMSKALFQCIEDSANQEQVAQNNINESADDGSRDSSLDSQVLYPQQDGIATML